MSITIGSLSNCNQFYPKLLYVLVYIKQVPMFCSRPTFYFYFVKVYNIQLSNKSCGPRMVEATRKKQVQQVGCSLQGVSLVEAKNGDKFFWEEEFHAANGKTQACTQGALLFFLLSLGGKGRKGRDFFFIFPSFPMCIYYFPFKFPLSSQHVPQHVLHSTSLLSHMLCSNVVIPSPLYLGQRGETLCLKIKPFILRSYHSFIFFLSNGPIKLIGCTKKNKNWGRPLI